jgi:hypothetical protein
MAKPIVQNLIMAIMNMNEIIMSKIKIVKIFMEKLNMATLTNE